jgi:hypothetical protein
MSIGRSSVGFAYKQGGKVVSTCSGCKIGQVETETWPRSDRQATSQTEQQLLRSLARTLIASTPLFFPKRSLPGQAVQAALLPIDLLACDSYADDVVDSCFIDPRQA